MNKRFNSKLGMGAALIAITFNAPFASAQIVPTANPAAATAPANPAPAATTNGIGDLNDLALVEGDSEAVLNRKTPPPVPLAMNQAARVSYISRDQWHKKGWSDESFNERRVQSVRLCGRINYFTMRFADLADRYRATVPEITEIAGRYDKMRRGIKRAGAIRTVANIFAPVIALAIPGGSIGYAGLVGAGALGGEATGRASTKAQLLNNDAGQINNQLTGYHIEFNLLSLELYTDYLDMMGRYCTNEAVIRSFDNTANPTASPSILPADSAGMPDIPRLELGPRKANGSAYWYGSKKSK